MPEPQWTAETVKLVGDALYAYAESLGMDPAMIRAYGAAVPVLATLAEAGLLVTPQMAAERDRLREAGRLLYGLFDAWWNHVGTWDPGQELICDGTRLTDIAALLDRDDLDRLTAAAEAVDARGDEIRTLLGVRDAFEWPR
jgi:hypothetical protein